MFRKRRRNQSIERRQVGARCLLEPLEPRILFSADPLSASIDGLIPNSSSDDSALTTNALRQNPDSLEEHLASLDSDNLSPQLILPKELVVIDVATPDYQQLLGEITANPNVDYQVLLLAGDQNGVAQISQYLSAFDEPAFSAIHIISHGDNGGVSLGNLTLDQTTVASQGDSFRTWSSSLTESADILFYGCNLAEDDSGQQLLKTIAEMTGADVAGSSDVTGASLWGADWELEFSVGHVESSLSLSTQFQTAWQHTLGPFGAVDALWLNSKDGATGLSIPGIPSISKAELLEFSDPNLSFEPAGSPSQTTDGTFSSIIDINVFDLTNGDIKIDAMHYVSADITIGQSSTIVLKAGDILMSSGGGAETLTSNNVQDVEKGDVLVFRPTVTNDYSSGDFFILFDNMVKDLHAISLVENDTVVGGTVLTKGSLIYSQSKDGSLDDKSIYVFNPIDVGESNTSGVHELLIDGAEIGIDENIHGLELIETDVTVGGSTLSAGSILISQNNGDDIGSNNLSVASGDVALLKITQATVGGASPVAAQATAALFFDGSDVGLAGIKYDGIALVSVAQNVEPVVTSTAVDPTLTEGGSAVTVFSATSIDVVDAGQNVKGFSLVIDNVVDGASEQIVVDGTSISLVNGATGATAGQGLSYEVTLNGASYTLVLKGGNMAVATAEAMIDGLRYNNTDQAPGTNARTITLTSLTDTGGTANNGDDTVDLNIVSTISVLSVNDAPTADATALNLNFSEGGAPSSLFSGADIQVIEAGQLITAMTFTVTNIENISSEYLRLDGSNVSLVDGQAGTTAGSSLSYSVSVLGSTATISLSGGSLNDAQANTIINNSAYFNLSQAPVAGVKTVTLTEVIDDGGMANGGDDTGSFSLSSTVSVIEVNNEPVVSGVGSDPNFVGGGSAVNPFNTLDIDLIESGQLVTGFVIEVTSVLDGASEKLIVDGSNIILINSSSGTTSGSGFDYDVSVGGSVRTVTFTNGAATSAAVEALINGLTYQNDSGSLSPGVRSITLTELTDNGGTNGGGDDSVALAITSNVSVITSNAEPTFVSTGSNPTYISAGASVEAFSSTNINTQNSGQTIIGLTFSISGLVDGADEKIVIDGSTIALTNGAVGVTIDNSISYSISEAGGNATIVLNGSSLSESQAENLVDSLAYINDAGTPSVGVRLIELTSLSDSGGTDNGGDDTVNVSIQSSIGVQSVNAEPSVNANPTDPVFVEGGGPVTLYSTASIDLVETGQKVVSFSFSVNNVFDGSDEVIAFDGTDIVLTTGNLGTTANNNISYLVTAAANFAIISFNHSGLSSALTESLILAMTYENQSDDPNTLVRDITLAHVQDSGGTANGGDDMANPLIISAVTVNAVNDQPVVSSVAIDADEDGAVINGSFLVTDADASDTHVFTIVGLPTEGSVVNNNDGTFSFDPGVDFQDLALGESRDVTFTYRATDNSGSGNAGSALATVTVTVSGANDRPVASAVSISADEDGASVGGSFGETDADSNGSHVFSITSMPSEGNVVNNNDGTFTFDPAGDFQDLAEGATRMVTFEYVVIDSSGAGNATSVAATVTVTVTGKNETPIVGDLSTSADEDGAVVNGSFSVADGDGGDTHTFTLVGLPAEGTVVNNNDGTFSFDPGMDFQDLGATESRDVSFTYRATDSSGVGNGDSLLATVTVTVTGTNDRPVVDAVSVSSPHDASVNGSFNVFDADQADSHLFSITTIPSGGSVTNNNDGTFTFDPGDDFEDLAEGDSRVVTFDYVATDNASEGNSSSVAATVTVTVIGNSEGHAVEDLSISANEDGLLVNGTFAVVDSKDDGDYSFEIVDLPAEGAVVNNNDGTFSFDPGMDFQDLSNGEVREVTFTYQAKDSSLESNNISALGNVTVAVTGVNDEPVVSSFVVNSAEDGSANTTKFSVSDVDALDVQTISVLSSPSEGTVINNDDGTFTFDPGTDFQDLAEGEVRNVSLTYQAVDDSGAANNSSAIETITFAVVGVNDRPTVSNVSLGAVEDGSKVLGSFSVNDIDSQDTHSFVITSAPAGGVVINNGDGTFSFDVGSDFQQLAHGEVESTSFTFAAVDSSGAETSTSVRGLVTVSLTGANDRPIVNDILVSLDSDETELIDTFDFIEIDLVDTTTVMIIEQPTQGSLIDLGNGTFKFSRDSGFANLSQGESTTVTATFQVLDDSGQSNALSRVGTIIIEVEGDGFFIVDPVGPPLTAPEVPSAPAAEASTPNESIVEAENPESGTGDLSSSEPSPVESADEESDGGDGPMLNSDAVGERLSDIDGSSEPDGLFDGVFSNLSFSVSSASIIQTNTEFERADANLAGAISIESVESLRVKFAVYNDPLSLVETERYMRGVDDIRNELQQASESRDTAMGGMFTVTAGLSAGYVVWLARSGILLSSVLSSLPAWRFIDPLPVLSGAQAEGVDDDESLEEMVSSSQADDQVSEEGDH